MIATTNVELIHQREKSGLLTQKLCMHIYGPQKCITTVCIKPSTTCLAIQVIICNSQFQWNALYLENILKKQVDELFYFLLNVIMQFSFQYKSQCWDAHLLIYNVTCESERVD